MFEHLMWQSIPTIGAQFFWPGHKFPLIANGLGRISMIGMVTSSLSARSARARTGGVDRDGEGEGKDV